MVRWLAIMFGLLGLWSAIFCQDSKYDNYTLMRIIPHTKHHLEKLGRLQHDPEGVEILKRSRGVNRTTDVLVAPHMRWLVEEFVSKHKMPVEYKYHYGRDFESIPKSSVRRGFNPYGFNSYDDIRSEIYLLVKNSPDIVTIQDVGESYEERKMSLVKISTNPRGRNPVIFVDAGIHAREWVAPAMAMYLMRRLIKDPEAKKRELKGVDWYILPVVNPDGYEFSRAKKSNRLWRKTRSKHTSEDCYGVDGNRNFGFEWGGAGTSKDPCHPEIYAGPKAFSEPETQIVAKIMNEYKQRIKLYVSLHSYGSYLVYPWGFTAELVPEKWFRLHNLARMASDSVVRAGGKAFEVMSAGQWYPAAGGSDDYALGMVGIPYSYTMELTKGFEFTFPEELLKNVLPQYYAAFITFSVQIKKEFSLT